MKKFAANNLMCLRKHHPNIYKLVRNKSFDQNRIKIDRSANNQANLKITLINKEEITLYSRYNPMEEAQRWLESIEDRYEGVQNILICGLGLGYHLQAFIERFPEKKIYLYEPDLEILMAAIECVDLVKLLSSKQLAIFAVGSGQAFQKQLMNLIFNSINGDFDYLVLPIYRKLNSSTIDELLDVIKSTSRSYRTNLKTLERFQFVWIENIVLNLEKVMKSYSFAPMKGVGRGVPAVIVGSGPSLEMEVEWLKKLKNRVYIIAAGSSAQGLLYHGVEPDLIVSMDPTEANHKAFESINISHIPFLFIPTIRHTILDRDWDYLLHAYFNNDLISQYFMELDDNEPIFLTTPTVTGTAIQAAMYMQCSEIVFIGQDFSYPNNRHYAVGVQHINQDVLNRKIDNAEEMVENVNGGFNKTSADMLVLKYGVENLLDSYKNIDFYNASRVGAVIRNTKIKTLETLYKERENTKVEDLRELIKKYTQPYSKEKIKHIIKKIETTKKEVSDLAEIVMEITGLIEESEKYVDTNLNYIQKWFKKFDLYWNKFVEHNLFNNLYTFMLSREYNHIRRHWNALNVERDELKKREKLIKCILPMIVGFQKVTLVFRASVEEVLRRLITLRDELEI